MDFSQKALRRLALWELNIGNNGCYMSWFVIR